MPFATEFCNLGNVQVPEDLFSQALLRAHQEVQRMIEPQNQLASSRGFMKRKVVLFGADKDAADRVMV